jgi:hypothetical protein
VIVGPLTALELVTGLAAQAALVGLGHISTYFTKERFSRDPAQLVK